MQTKMDKRVLTSQRNINKQSWNSSAQISLRKLKAPNLKKRTKLEVLITDKDM